MKYSWSSSVYLFPRPPGTIRVGGVGEREGGSGTTMSACGGSRPKGYLGTTCAVRELIVRRFGSRGVDTEDVIGVRSLRLERP
jgi:hypothetical protein